MATRPSAAELALREIRGAIASGEITGGSMVSENELAARIGVSRTPVRAALARLQDEGWVTIFPRRGALVREIGPEEERHIADARHAVEYGSVRTLGDAERADLAERLTGLADLETQRLAEGDLDGFVDVDINFHRSLVVAGANPVLLDLYDRLRGRQAQVVARRAATKTVAQRLLDDHRSFIDLIARGRIDELDGALLTHLRASAPRA